MINKETSGVFILFCICALLISVYEFTHFVLVSITLLFIAILVCSFFLKGVTSRLFMAIVCVSHIAGVWTLYVGQEDYTFSGWSAVKEFDFSGGQYLDIFLPVVFMYTFMLFIMLLIEFSVPVFNAGKITSPRTPEVSSKSKRTRRSGIIIIFIILLMLPVHNFMFKNLIAVTGMAHLQEPLPYKIGGFLYYFTKIILPLGIVFLYHKARVTPLLFIIVLLYAFLACISQNSRSMLLMIVVPMVYIHTRNKQFFYASLNVIFLLFAALLIDFLRDLNAIFAIIEVNKGQSLYTLLYNSLQFMKTWMPASQNLINITSRFGGGQDVVLGAQYSITITGGLSENLSRVFLGDLSYASQASQHLYGFKPKQGLSVGYGGITSQFLQVSRNDYLLMCVIIILFSIIIKLCDYTISAIAQRLRAHSLAYVLSLPVLLLIFIYSNFVLIYSYLIFLICIAVMSRLSVSLGKRGRF